MISIRKSPTADTRTCDPSTVTKEQLLESSLHHIGDVAQAMAFFAGKLGEALIEHDRDKITQIDWFHADFTTDILKPDGWLANHYKIHRHHLDKETGCPDDVNLIDVLEHIADCVVAGMGRSGDVWPIKLTDEQLQRAVVNTVKLLKRNIIVED